MTRAMLRKNSIAVRAVGARGGGPPPQKILGISGYIVMLRARIFRSLIIRTGIKERNIRARNITI